MKKSDYGILFLVALFFFSLLATLQKVPGYMDAEYYFGQGIRIVQHHDFVENIIWNYLNDPSSVSTPGFAFWLPGTSIFAAVGMWMSGSIDFFYARLVFILMAACIPLMAAFFATRFLPNRRAGWLAGLLAVFSGLYIPFITLTETFTPYMFFGGLFFTSIWFAIRNPAGDVKINLWFIGTGVAAGLLSLIRSDGLLWLPGGFLAVLFVGGLKKRVWINQLVNLFIVLLGFALVMAPWYLRNLATFNAVFPSGNGLMLWLTKYDDLFVYPSSELTFSSWIASGIGNIALDRLKALGGNLQTLIAAGGAIFLAPMMVIGYWKQRRSIVIKLASILLLAILAAMTLIFPYAGERGGFFHSLSSIQVILWSLVPVGLEVIIQWGVKHRNWKTERSWRMFGPALVVVAGFFSAMIFSQKITNSNASEIPWNQTQNGFISIEDKLIEMTNDRDGVIMVNNPPGYTLATGRPGIMIPTGGTNALLEVSERYDAQYLVLNNERTDVIVLFQNDSRLKEYFDFMFKMVSKSVYEVKP